MQDVKAIGARIRKRRKMLGLTLADLAARLQVSHVTIHDWEKGNIRRFSEERISTIAAALETSPSDLMHGVRVIDEGDRRVAEMTEREYIADAVREALVDNDWTQAELAERMDVDVSVVSRILSRERRPTRYQLYQLEKLLGITLRNKPWTVISAHTLVMRIPAEAPKGYVEFLQSRAFAALHLTPIQVALLAGMVGHPDYWTPRNEREWAELADAMLSDLFDGEVGFAIKLTGVDTDLLKQLDER